MEALQGMPVAYPAKNMMDSIIPGFQVHLDTASCFQGKSRHSTQEGLLDRSICLPTYPEQLSFSGLECQFRGAKGMKYLSRRIPAKKTDAAYALIHGPGQVRRLLFRTAEGEIPVVVVLAEKAVERTTMVEDGQIEPTVLRFSFFGIDWISTPGSPRTDPVRHAVGRKGILVPRDPAFMRPASHQTSSSARADPAVTNTSLGNATTVHADLALQAFLSPGRLGRKTVRSPALLVDQVYAGPNFLEMLSYA